MARNPFADVIKVPFTSDVYLNAGPHDRTAADLQLQPLIPIHISPGWLLIPRILVTAVTYAPDSTGESRKLGLGDIAPSFFFTPAKCRPAHLGRWAHVADSHSDRQRTGVGTMGIRPFTRRAVTGRVGLRRNSGSADLVAPCFHQTRPGQSDATSANVLPQPRARVVSDNYPNHLGRLDPNR